MLKQLSVSNYALIEHINVSFDKGLTIITGETGAGKSILLGALGLILGERADSSAMRDESRKCIVEGQFEISSYHLQEFFNEHELDYDQLTTLRREIAPGGKSRAFINDTPVTLNVLRDLAEQLIDIHSQHETRLLTNAYFQLGMLDVYAENQALVQRYRNEFRNYTALRNKKRLLSDELSKAALNQSFLEFQYNELAAAKLENPDELVQVEKELDILSHAEVIKQNLSGTYEILSNSEGNVLELLQQVKSMLHKAGAYHPESELLHRRVDAVIIELKDLAAESGQLEQGLEFDQEKMFLLSQRVDLLNKLLGKHRASTLSDLIELRDKTERDLQQINGNDDELKELDGRITVLENQLSDLAAQISESRKSSVGAVTTQVQALLGSLGMLHAELKIVVEESAELKSSGRNDIHFLIRTNKGTDFHNIDKVASGGELSRVMLCLKAVNAARNVMPTIIFDEIDTGISGEIASKTGDVLKKLGSTMQVISISHLPQIAGKGDAHFKVSKQTVGNSTVSHITALSQDERIREIAAMISGAEVTEAALQNARILLAE